MSIQFWMSLVLLAGLPWGAWASDLSQKASELKINFNSAVLDPANYNTKSDLKFPRAGLLTYSDSSGHILQISNKKVATEAQALHQIQNKLIQLKILYQPQATPYPGMVTKVANCFEGVSLPEKIEKTKSEIFATFRAGASSNFAYGTCNPEQEIYQSQMLLLYCKSSKTLFEIKFFAPKGSSPDLKPTLASCEAPR